VGCGAPEGVGGLSPTAMVTTRALRGAPSADAGLRLCGPPLFPDLVTKSAGVPSIRYTHLGAQGQVAFEW
jgi:hypothetical protein